MNILFDLVTTYKITGASEYVRRVFYGLLEAKKKRNDINIYAVVDLAKGSSAYVDLSEIANAERGIQTIDINKSSISKIVSDKKIDKIFIGCAQFWGGYKDLAEIRCGIVCVVHDLSFEEKSSNFIDLWMQMYRSNIHFAWNWGKSLLKGAPNLELMKPYKLLMNNNNNFIIVSVSEYTKYTLKYQFDFDESRISVLYSPERIYANSSTNFQNEVLRSLIANNKKYYLVLHANRPMKNTEKVFRAFEKYVKHHNDMYLVTVGSSEKRCNNHVALPALNESDLVNAYSNCYALIYPSLFEGFGYPPLEAMHFGKPVLCSNVCSMPEILADAPIYFSPFYDSDIFRAMCTLNDNNYAHFAAKSIDRYSVISKKQEEDLKALIKLIVNNE